MFFRYILYLKGMKKVLLRFIIPVLLIPVMLFSMNHCRGPRPMLSEGVSQGISGTVLWYEGDLMPGIDKEPVEGKPIERKILIYEVTHPDQADVIEPGFYGNLQTRLITVTHSDGEGKFIVALEPGTYSVLVEEPKGLFANTFNEKGEINPVTIHKDELVVLRIRVDYMAAY